MDLREDGKGNFCQRKLLMIYNPQPEYLIARSQLTLGSVGIRSHSIFYAILDNYIYIYMYMAVVLSTNRYVLRLA